LDKIIKNLRVLKGSVHAEIDLLRNLPILRKKKNLKKIDIEVFKISGTKENPRLGNSKPCWNCICTLFKFSPKKGYRIGNVYYSNELGDICKTTLNKLLLDKPYISRGNR